MVLIMGNKKVFLLLSSLLIMGLLSNVVSAQEEGAGLGEAFGTIQELFAFLPDLVTLEKLIGGDTAAIFWAKFLVWLLLFAVLFFGAGKVFPDNNRIAVIVALVIALMGALLIPNSILINIFQTYGLVAGIVIWAIPLVAGMYIAHKVENPFARALIYGLAAWILFSINKTVVKSQGFANTNFPFFGLLLAVVIILFFWNLGQIFGIGGGAGGGWGSGLGRGAWDWATSKGDGGGRGSFGGGKTPEEKEADEQKKIEAEEKEVAGLAEREQGVLNKLITVSAASLNEDIKIEKYLNQVRDFVEKFLGSTLKYGIAGCNAFKERKSQVVPKIEEIINIINRRKQVDDKVTTVIENNKNLLRMLLKVVRKTPGQTHKAVKDLLEKKPGWSGKKANKKRVAIYNELFDKESSQMKIGKVEEHLNKVILKEEEDRTKGLVEIEKSLTDAIDELNRIENSIATGKNKQSFKKVIKFFDKAIKKFEEVVKIDECILRREREMYTLDKFLETILGEARSLGGKFTTPTGDNI
jgi:Trp operon repressor